MRSILLTDLNAEFLKIGEFFVVTDEEQIHHLAKVCRVKEGEQLLILCGKGRKIFSKIEKVEKKTITVFVEKIVQESPQTNLSVFFCLLKKEANSTLIKYAIELGINNIYPVISQFSQREFLSEGRLFNLIESAMIQSNNPFFPHIADTPTPLEKIDWTRFDFVFYFTEKKRDQSQSFEQLDQNSKIAFLIGPEAGLSEDEEQKLIDQLSSMNLLKAYFIHLPSYILKAPTALSAGTGFIFSMMK